MYLPFAIKKEDESSPSVIAYVISLMTLDLFLPDNAYSLDFLLEEHL